MSESLHVTGCVPMSSPSLSEKDQQEDVADVADVADDSMPEYCCPDDSKLVKVQFGEGPLGVTLRRRTEGGVAYVFHIIPDSQATNLDVLEGDDLWAVGSMLLKEDPIEKDGWSNLINFIKSSERPVTMWFRRRLKEDEADDSASESQDETTEEVEVDKKEVGAEVLENENHDDSACAEEEEEVEEQEHLSPEQLEQLEKEKHMEILTDMARLLVFKEKEKSSFWSSSKSGSNSPGRPTTMDVFVKEGRRLLKEGSVSLQSAGSLWSSQTKRQLFLCSDILIVSSPSGSKFQVDQTIDLQACKINIADSEKSDPSAASSSSAMVFNPELMFSIIWPGGVLTLVVKSNAEKIAWTTAIFDAICGCIEPEGRVLGWRHQYFIGTLHSAVISRDEAKVRDILHTLLYKSVEGDYDAIDKVDADGYSPLLYACILRLHGIIRILLEANADVTIADRRGYNALHWAALQLDYQSLSLLCGRVFTSDLEDLSGRTPLFLACVEGRDLSGKSDAVALRKCIQCLLALNADPNVADRNGVSILKYLVASWQFDAAELLIEARADLLSPSGICAFSALHFAASAAPLKRAVGEGSRLLLTAASAPSAVGIEGVAKNRERSVGSIDSQLGDLSSELYNAHGATTPRYYHSGAPCAGSPEVVIYADGERTLRVLLEAGARPNAKDAQGRSPLHIVAEREIFWGSYLKDAVSALVEAGARFDDSPLCNLLRSKCDPNRVSGTTSPASTKDHQTSGFIDTLIERRLQKPTLNGDFIGLRCVMFLSFVAYL